ncbi:hypothetical protein BTA51_04495 [Hahella sp. CCB-MM4]|nr:hypothetical protein BTA51_04495 [Hahella sp. CCB-MM4]
MTKRLTLATGFSLIFSTFLHADSGVGADPQEFRLALNQSFSVPVTKPLPVSEIPVVDMVLVKKRDRTLSLISNGVPFRVYNIALGDDPIGHKQFEGDERTPEGAYTLDWRNPNSHYYKSIHVSYPNPDDIAYAESRGKDPGGMIMIHGWPNAMKAGMSKKLLNEDWTDGCIALTNTAMDEVWRLVSDGTPIVIKP